MKHVSLKRRALLAVLVLAVVIVAATVFAETDGESSNPFGEQPLGRSAAGHRNRPRAHHQRGVQLPVHRHPRGRVTVCKL